jgi:hypothetical protein
MLRVTELTMVESVSWYSIVRKKKSWYNIPLTPMYLGVDEGMGLKRPQALSSLMRLLHSRTSPLASHSSTTFWNLSSVAVKNRAAWSNTRCSPSWTTLVAILPPRSCIPCSNGAVSLAWRPKGRRRTGRGWGIERQCFG